MNKTLAGPTEAYRSLIAGYTGEIRSSDFKANIAFLFVAFMMGSVLWNYTSLPSYLPVQVLLPFLIVYLLLFMVLFPRYPKRGQELPRSARPDACGFRVRRPGWRRHRTVEADLRSAVRHSLVEDPVRPSWLPASDHLRVPDLGSASIRRAQMMLGRAPRVRRSV